MARAAAVTGPAVRMLAGALALGALCSLGGCRGATALDKLPYDASVALVVVAPDPSRRSPADDARAKEAVTSALTWQGFSVTPVAPATRAQLDEALLSLATGPGARPRTRLFIYIRAHGITQINAAGKASGALALADTPTGPDIVPPGPLAALTVEEIDRWARRLTARHLFIALDSCFSGSPFTPQGAPAERLPAAPEAPTLHYLVAGDGIQCAAGNTVFALALAQALQRPILSSDAQRSFISGSELADEVQDRVAETTRGLQLPRGGKSNVPAHAQGEFLLEARPSRAR